MSNITFYNNTGESPSASCITASSFSSIDLAKNIIFRNNTCIGCESSINLSGKSKINMTDSLFEYNEG